MPSINAPLWPFPSSSSSRYRSYLIFIHPLRRRDGKPLGVVEWENFADQNERRLDLWTMFESNSLISVFSSQTAWGASSDSAPARAFGSQTWSSKGQAVRIVICSSGIPGSTGYYSWTDLPPLAIVWNIWVMENVEQNYSQTIIQIDPSNSALERNDLLASFTPIPPTGINYFFFLAFLFSPRPQVWY